jgi:hypothetical protein
MASDGNFGVKTDELGNFDAKGRLMPLRPSLSSAASFATAALIVLCTGTAAFAADGGWRNGSWYDDVDAGPRRPAPPSRDDRRYPDPEPRQAPRDLRDDRTAQEESRFSQPGADAWLADCRRRVSARDNGVGGAVIGGAVGGLAGNRIAGRHNRTVGTVAGVAVGAVAGSAIDRAEDRGRAQDECEAYLDDYYARYAEGQQPQPPYGYDRPRYASGYVPAYTPTYAPGYAYPAANCCTPVQVQPECTETIEYVYEDVPVPRRTYRRVAKRQRVVADKRIKIVPDKRVSLK